MSVTTATGHLCSISRKTHALHRPHQVTSITLCGGVSVFVSYVAAFVDCVHPCESACVCLGV